MAEQNPIKYSDLISPDDSIEKLITQLEKVTEAYNGLAASVKSQAASISSSLKTISGATEQGRASTRSASQEVDRLTKAYKDLEFAQSDTAKRIADLKQIQKEQNMMNKLTAESNRAVEGSYNALSAQYRLNKMYINNLTKAERENDPAAKKLIEETRQIYEEMNKMQQATGKFSLNGVTTRRASSRPSVSRANGIRDCSSLRDCSKEASSQVCSRLGRRWLASASSCWHCSPTLLWRR